jgi:hypothetical protein
MPGPPQPVFPPPPMIGSASGLPAYTMPPAGGASAHQAPPPPAAGGSTTPGTQSPTSGGPLYSTAQAPAGGTPAPATPAWDRPGGTYGVGVPGGVRPPFGGSAAQVGTPPPRPETHGAVPQQRLEGTVYGGQAPPDMTMPVPAHAADMTMPVPTHVADMTMPVPMNFNAAVENSGSLTGHILAQGWDRGVDTNRRSNVKVGIAMLLVLVFLVGISVLFLFTAGDAFTDMINGVFGGS